MILRILVCIELDSSFSKFIIWESVFSVVIPSVSSTSMRKRKQYVSISMSCKFFPIKSIYTLNINTTWCCQQSSSKKKMNINISFTHVISLETNFVPSWWRRKLPKINKIETIKILLVHQTRSLFMKAILTITLYWIYECEKTWNGDEKI